MSNYSSKDQHKSRVNLKVNKVSATTKQVLVPILRGAADYLLWSTQLTAWLAEEDPTWVPITHGTDVPAADAPFRRAVNSTLSQDFLYSLHAHESLESALVGGELWTWIKRECYGNDYDDDKRCAPCAPLHSMALNSRLLQLTFKR